MQISAAIIEKSIYHYIPANIVPNNVSRPMFSGSTIIKGPFLSKLRIFMACYANSKMPALPKMSVFHYKSANIAGKFKRVFEGNGIRNGVVLGIYAFQMKSCKNALIGILILNQCYARSWNRLCHSQLSCVSVCSDGFQLASIRHFVMEEHTDTKKAPTVPVCSDTSADGVSPGAAL